jgi:hypothetical protein
MALPAGQWRLVHGPPDELLRSICPRAVRRRARRRQLDVVVLAVAAPRPPRGGAAFIAVAGTVADTRPSPAQRPPPRANTPPRWGGGGLTASRWHSIAFTEYRADAKRPPTRRPGSSARSGIRRARARGTGTSSPRSRNASERPSARKRVDTGPRPPRPMVGRRRGSGSSTLVSSNRPADAQSRRSRRRWHSGAPRAGFPVQRRSRRTDREPRRREKRRRREGCRSPARRRSDGSPTASHRRPARGAATNLADACPSIARPGQPEQRCRRAVGPWNRRWRPTVDGRSAWPAAVLGTAPHRLRPRPRPPRTRRPRFGRRGRRPDDERRLVETLSASSMRVVVAVCVVIIARSPSAAWRRWRRRAGCDIAFDACVEGTATAPSRLVERSPPRDGADITLGACVVRPASPPPPLRGGAAFGGPKLHRQQRLRRGQRTGGQRSGADRRLIEALPSSGAYSIAVNACVAGTAAATDAAAWGR